MKPTIPCKICKHWDWEIEVSLNCPPRFIDLCLVGINVVGTKEAVGCEGFEYDASKELFGKL